MTDAPPTWTELQTHYPELWKLAAKNAWDTHRRNFPEDSDLERAYRADKARGFDPRLAHSPTEDPQPWRSNGLKAPPYTKDFPERLTRTHELRIFVGRAAWKRAQEARQGSSHAITLLPPGDNPALYDWGFCAGRVPLLINAGAFPEEIEATAKGLLAVQAVAVVAIDKDGQLSLYEAE